ncbi:MAG: OstA-like protein [candidate division NC10 bacterium]|nr:OstA-like protein [candidate division NC10 bacterium]
MRACEYMLAAILCCGAATAGLSWAAEEKSPITISADNLEVNRKSRLAVYRGNVSAVDRGRGLSILADQIDFLFDERMEDLERAVATGNVRITYGERRGASDRAEYTPRDARVVLLGHPKIWQDSDVVTGCKISLLLREERSAVEGCQGERVNVVLYPKRSEAGAPQAPRR